MSLYNALFGKNRFSGLLLAMLDLDQEGGKWHTGRFRDIHLDDTGEHVILFTRNGGGNRECWNEEMEPGIDCSCPGCVIEYLLPRHPQYVGDWDDDYDSTYAYVKFRTPAQFLPLAKALSVGESPQTVSGKFKLLCDSLEAGEDSPTVRKALEVGKRIFGAIDSATSEGGVHVIEV